MATLANGALTLADWAKRTTPNGGIETRIAEILSQQNEILEDAVFMEGNLPTGHRVTIRTGLPAVYWRSINQGVPRSKSTTAQVDESVGMLEAYSPVDKDLMDLNGNTAAFRQSEDSAFMESMNQTQAKTMIYGNPATDARQYLGLAGRYGTISGAGNAANILDAGGTLSANTSVYLVVWGENTVFCPFPKGSRAGLVSTDDGLLTVYDSNNNPYKAYQTHYQWKNGLVVKDWRYVVRICNIDTATMAALSGTQATTAVATNILHMMLRAIDRIPNFGMGRPCFYMNRSVFSLLRRLAMEKSVNALALEAGANQFGTPMRWASFEGIPLRKVDQILNTEARVI
jgi:hypothetical protein